MQRVCSLVDVFDQVLKDQSGVNVYDVSALLLRAIASSGLDFRDSGVVLPRRTFAGTIA